MQRQGIWLALQKPEKEDIPVMLNWLKDPAFIENIYGSPLAAPSQTISNIHRMLNDNARDVTGSLTLIGYRYDGVPIGLFMFNNINWKNRSAELNAAIGSIEHRSAIYGGELYLLGLLVAFQELNLEKIYGYVYESNESSFRLSSFAGKKEGVLRKHFYRKGDYIDVTVFSLLRQEFEDFIEKGRKSILRRHHESGLL